MMTFRKAALYGAISLATPLVALSSAAAQSVPAARVAVVDSARILQECTACVSAQSQIQAQLTALQQRAQTLAQPLETEGTAIQTAVQALAGKQPDAALRTRIETFQRNQQAANTEITAGERNIQSIRQNVLQQISAQLRPIITAAMTSSGANVVVDKSSTLANIDGVEITNTVLGTLNQRLPAVSVTPLPQQAAPAAPAQPGR